MEGKKKVFKPTSILLGELKAPLQQKAMEMDRSLNWIVNSMLKDHPYLADYHKKKSAVKQ